MKPDAGLVSLPADTSALMMGRSTGQVNHVRTSSSCVTTAEATPSTMISSSAVSSVAFHGLRQTWSQRESTLEWR